MADITSITVGNGVFKYAAARVGAFRSVEPFLALEYTGPRAPLDGAGPAPDAAVVGARLVDAVRCRG